MVGQHTEGLAEIFLMDADYLISVFDDSIISSYSNGAYVGERLECRLRGRNAAERCETQAEMLVESLVGEG